jgi:hypothetical protein
LRANGSGECPPDDRLREAIHSFLMPRDELLCFARDDDTFRSGDAGNDKGLRDRLAQPFCFAM